MFGIDILDVAIGLFFGHLVLSLAVTAANEMSAAWFRRRAWMLHKGSRPCSTMRSSPTSCTSIP